MLSLIKDSFRPLYHFLTNRNYRSYQFLHSKHKDTPRYTTKSIKFLSYRFDVPDALSFVFQFKEIFFEETYNFKARSKKPFIVDCGANIGLSCLYFKNIYPECRIMAFEADPHIYSFLESNLSKNNLKGIEIHNKAVWINSDGVSFSQDGADGGSIIDPSQSNLRVKSIRLKEVLLTEKVDFLKLDIEGAEIDVLIDCSSALKNVQNLFFEFHSFRNKPQRLHQTLEILSQSGFRYFLQSPHTLNGPFIKKSIDQQIMDLQLNVYCYRV